MRLAVSLLLMTIGGSGMYSVTVVLPYTVTMVGFGLGGILQPPDRPQPAPAPVARRSAHDFEQTVQAALVDRHHGLFAHLRLGVIGH